MQRSNDELRGQILRLEEELSSFKHKYETEVDIYINEIVRLNERVKVQQQDMKDGEVQRKLSSASTPRVGGEDAEGCAPWDAQTRPAASDSALEHCVSELEERCKTMEGFMQTLARSSAIATAIALPSSATSSPQRKSADQAKGLSGEAQAGASFSAVRAQWMMREKLVS